MLTTTIAYGPKIPTKAYLIELWICDDVWRAASCGFGAFSSCLALFLTQHGKYLPIAPLWWAGTYASLEITVGGEQSLKRLALQLNIYHVPNVQIQLSTDENFQSFYFLKSKDTRHKVDGSMEYRCNIIFGFHYNIGFNYKCTDSSTYTTHHVPSSPSLISLRLRQSDSQ